MTFAYFLWREEIATSFMNDQLARVTLVSLATKTPYTVIALETEGILVIWEGGGCVKGREEGV